MFTALRASPKSLCEKGSLSRPRPVNILHMLKGLAGETLSWIMYLLSEMCKPKQYTEGWIKIQ